MTCDKCTDIHTAQREGKTQEECSCGCHVIKDNPLVSPPRPLDYWYYPTCTPCCTPCCPCTDPNNAGKAMWLVCNCHCHGYQFTTSPNTICFSMNGAVLAEGPIRAGRDC